MLHPKNIYLLFNNYISFSQAISEELQQLDCMASASLSNRPPGERETRLSRDLVPELSVNLSIVV